MSEKTKEIMNGLANPSEPKVLEADDLIDEDVQPLSLEDVEGDLASYQDCIVDIRGQRRKVRIALASGEDLAEIFQEESDAGNLSPLEKQLAEMEDATPEKIREASKQAVEGMSLSEQLEIQRRDATYKRHILLNFVLMLTPEPTPLIVDTETDTLKFKGQIPLNAISHDIREVLVESYYLVNNRLET